MCGIVGYIRERNAVSVLIDGLKRLEYRGYDSAGIAFYENGNNNIALRKAVGKLVNLESILNGCEYESHLYWSYKVGNTRKTQ